MNVSESTIDIGVDIRVHLLHHLFEYLAIIDRALIRHVARDPTVGIGNVSARDVVALLVEEAFVYFVIAHEMVIIIAIRHFYPFLAILAAFLIV